MTGRKKGVAVTLIVLAFVGRNSCRAQGFVECAENMFRWFHFVSQPNRPVM